MNILVCVDRDGTINLDENYFLGSSPNWKEQLEFLPRVVEGIKALNQISDLEIAIVTNQAGVALTDPQFQPLDEERMHEVNQYMIEQLKKQGAIIQNYFATPYVNSAYVEKSKQRGRNVNPQYVQDNNPNLKPSPGMIFKAAERLGKKPEELRIYMIGDRKSDVETGLNANSFSILIPSSKTIEIGDEEKVRELQKEHPNQIYIAKDFLDAAQYIEKHQHNL
jgi:histidinol-phosphate phosphatase family protein